MKIRKFLQRSLALAGLGLALHPVRAAAEVTNVVITSQGIVAGGRSFGNVGTYERLVGRIEFALDPADLHNRGITDLAFAPTGPDGRVHFSSDVYVLRPVNQAKGNGVLLFEVANRGSFGGPSGLFGMINGGDGTDPDQPEYFGDALLLRDGYTIVWVGWEFDLPPGRLRLDPPAAVIPPGTNVDPLSLDVIVNERVAQTTLADEPVRPPAVYPPLDVASVSDTLTVRTLYWDESTPIPRAQWRWVVDGNTPPRIEFDGGFDPGRWYRVTYHAAHPVVAGVALAAIRDAASAFRYRGDLPVRGRITMAYGNSQTGRFLRLFLYEGFNADEHDRRVFDGVWSHIAGAARGGYNRRFATPAHGDQFRPTEFPFTDADEVDVNGARGGLQSRYRPDLRPKVFYTNTPVEYWGGGRAAALIHTSVDGTRDLPPPDNVRIYYLSGTQHLVGPFPPVRSLPTSADVEARARARFDGQELSNPTPQRNVMRALLRAFHDWAVAGVAPPPSQYPRLNDHTLVPIPHVAFPTLPGVANPRRITGPGRMINGTFTPLPHLVPQVDRDGNDIAGIHDPEAAVPLATTTGWNFRREGVGNPADIYQTLGAYIPFAATRAERETAKDPRLSLEERYRGIDDYLRRVRNAAMDLIRRRYLLAEDLDSIVERAKKHWNFATQAENARSAKSWTPSRTPDGQPDLQGVWVDNTITPFERPADFKGRALLTDDELATLKARAARLFDGSGDTAIGDELFMALLRNPDEHRLRGTGDYNLSWVDVPLVFENRTSQIVDPPDGQLPALTAEGRSKAAAAEEASRLRPADGPESRAPSERCLTFGTAHVGFLSARNNSFYQIVQTRDYVMIHSEMIHEARIIPLSRRPHLSPDVRFWSGDSRGRWEGQTLVIETTNFTKELIFRQTRGLSVSGEHVHLTERLTPLAADVIEYAVTVDDPTTWTRPWTAVTTWKRSNERMFEFACHEANYSLVNILRGARAEERQLDGQTGRDPR